MALDINFPRVLFSPGYPVFTKNASVKIKHISNPIRALSITNYLRDRCHDKHISHRLTTSAFLDQKRYSIQSTVKFPGTLSRRNIPEGCNFLCQSLCTCNQRRIRDERTLSPGLSSPALLFSFVIQAAKQIIISLCKNSGNCPLFRKQPIRIYS